MRILDEYRASCRAIAAIFPGMVEVVLHDLVKKQIHHIENRFSARREGDASLVDIANYESELQPDGTIGPYSKTNSDGTRIKSISSIIRDENDRDVGLLCINMRIDEFERMSHLMERLAALPQAENTVMLKNDWREAAHEIIARSLERMHISMGQAKRAHRQVIVTDLLKGDIFHARGSVDYVAETLNISRATLYQMMKEIKKSDPVKAPKES